MKRWLALAGVIAALALASALAVTGSAATLEVDSATLDAFASDQPAPTTSSTAGDTTAPQLTSLEMHDVDADGKVDQVKATFGETLAAYTAGTAPWTLASVPSGGTLSGVTVSGSVATLAISEGAGAPNTAVGSFTVALAQNAAGVRDAAGNRASFAATAPTDRAAPVLIGVADSSGSTDGLAQVGDSVAFTFSEALAPATLVSSTNIELKDPPGNDPDTIEMSGLMPQRSLGGNGYVSKNNTTVTFPAASVGFDAASGNKTVRVTITTACSTSCSDLGSGIGDVSFQFVPGLTGLDGLSTVGATAPNVRLF